MTKGLDPVLIALLAVGIFTITGGAVYATQIISQDFVIEAGAGEPGNLILQDGNLGVGGTPGPNQLIRAEGDPNQPIAFLVKSVNAEAVFNLRSFGGIPAVQLTDGDSGQKYRLRINQPSEDFEIVDTTLGQNVRLLIQPNGNVGIGVTNPQEKLDVFGNTHISGNADIDGNLNVDGVITGSFIQGLLATIAANGATITDLEARLAALEASMAINEPMIITNEAMIATHDTTLTSHDAMILSNQADIATNAAAIEAGGGGPNPCDPDGDGSITAQEMFDYMISIGFTNISVTVVVNLINNVENSIFLNPNVNGVLDSDAEITKFNTDYFISAGHPPCPLI